MDLTPYEAVLLALLEIRQQPLNDEERKVMDSLVERELVFVSNLTGEYAPTLLGTEELIKLRRNSYMRLDKQENWAETEVLEKLQDRVEREETPEAQEGEEEED